MGRNKTIFGNPRKKRVVVLENYDFLWDEPELDEIVEMWNEEVSIVDMAKHFDREPVEALFAVIHLALKGKIDPRKTGLGEWT